jgi:hypothetical protein
MMMLPAVMPREALRRLGQACAVRLIASNASTSITSHPRMVLPAVMERDGLSISG